MHSFDSGNFAITPSDFWDDKFYTTWTNSRTNMGITEQLYTARGSQG